MLPKITLVGAHDERQEMNGHGVVWKTPWPEMDSLRSYVVDLIGSNTVVVDEAAYKELYAKDGYLLDKEESTCVVLSSTILDRSEMGPPRHLAHADYIFPDVISLVSRLTDEEVFVLGGPKAYRMLYPLAESIHVTTIQGEYGGEFQFPDYASAVDDGIYEVKGADVNQKDGWRRLEFSRSTTLPHINLLDDERIVENDYQPSTTTENGKHL